MGDLMKRIRALESTKKKKIDTQGSDELEYGKHDDASDEIDKEIENLREEADAIWEKCKEHADSSNYGHLVQLKIRSLLFYNALLNFFADKSKRPHG